MPARENDIRPFRGLGQEEFLDDDKGGKVHRPGEVGIIPRRIRSGDKEQPCVGKFRPQRVQILGWTETHIPGALDIPASPGSHQAVIRAAEMSGLN